MFASYLEYIIESMAAVKALRVSESKFRLYINNSPDSIFIVDKSGKYLEVNPAACLLLGYIEEELLTRSIPDLLSPESLAIGINAFSNLREIGNNRCESDLLKKDNTKVTVVLDSVSLPEDKFIGLCKDISARKQALKKQKICFSVHFNLLTNLF